MEFKLLKEQKPHNKRCLSFLEKHSFFVDNSATGCGKTYNYVSLAREKGVPLFVISPLTTHENVKRVAEMADVDLVHICTPQSLASKKGCQPKHGYLRRVESVGKKPLRFVATKKLRDLAKEGCLFILDEVQFARNINTWFKACRSIVDLVGLFKYKLQNDPCDKSKRSSYCGFVSTTPFDRATKCIHFMMLIGLIPKAYTCTRKIKPDILKSLAKYADSEGIELEDPLVSVENVLHFFLEHVRPKYVSSMPLIMDNENECKNAFYLPRSKKEEDGILEAISDLNNVFIKIMEDGKMTKQTFGKLTLARVKVETAKRQIFCREIKRLLTENEKAKVVVCLHFTKNIMYLADKLKKFKPIILTGKVKSGDRQSIIDEFQDPNTKRRLIICNLRVGGVGISLHDTHGEYPRKMLISPDYNTIDLFQALGRINRVGTKSKVWQRFVYANVKYSEKGIMRAIANRFGTIKKTLGEAVREEIKLPNDFEDYYEGGKAKFEIKDARPNKRK